MPRPPWELKLRCRRWRAPEDFEIPAGTQPGQVFKLRRRGMPDPRGGGKGDLLVIINLEVPKSLSPKQDKLLRDMAVEEKTNVSPHRKSFLEKVKDYFVPDAGRTAEGEKAWLKIQNRTIQPHGMDDEFDMSMLGDPTTPELTSEGEMDLARADLAEARDKMLRAQAELDNYRKRARRELDDERRYAEINLLRDLLPVLDNIHRAVDAAEKKADLAALLSGFKMVAPAIGNTAGAASVQTD